MQRNDAKFIQRQVAIARIHKFQEIVPGKFRKRSAMDCGNPKCGICGNSRRVRGTVTVNELRADEAFKYEVVNYDGQFE